MARLRVEERIGDEAITPPDVPIARVGVEERALGHERARRPGYAGAIAMTEKTRPAGAAFRGGLISTTAMIAEDGRPVAKSGVDALRVRGNSHE
jgi:hypothetical protein